MSGNVIPRAILQAVGTNGIGRYVPQLQRITIKFCKSRSDSKGVRYVCSFTIGQLSRDYIEGYLVDFARRNPATVVYVKPRRHRPPLLVAEYLCGNWQYVKASQMECEEIHNWMEFLRNRSGLDIMPIYKTWSTKSPSIQGMWHPFNSESGADCVLSPEEIRKNLHILSEPVRIDEFTAEDRLLDLAEKQQLRVDS
ncbi:39S ribosomal protein L43, mitochondrial [Clonorchis sinensis]|uniref:Large ribosomal subunit protein mL43 n=1 Tax=Clonorchis sinensis TaxID=79923 RepID=A0A3R7JH22_CLOSI|nr:39S ribosomal protein L43, mitochondrial [Clonorchis sinensis]